MLRPPRRLRSVLSSMPGFGARIVYGLALFPYSWISTPDLDFVEFGFTQMNHPIEDGTSDAGFDLLSFPASRLEFRSENDLVAEHRRFHQRSSMIATILFPSFPSLTPDGLHPLVACFNMSVASFCFPELGIPTRGNDGLHGRVLSRRIGQRMMNFPAIIRSVTIQADHLIGRLCQHRFDLRRVIGSRFRQGFCRHFSRIDIQAQMQFSPGASCRPAMLARFPFSFSIQLQSRAIDRDMTGLVRRMNRQVHGQSFLSPRKSRVIRRAQFQPHQAQQRPDKSLGLAQRQVKQLAKGQRRLDGLIRIHELRSALRRSRVIPSGKGFFAQPHRQTTALDQGLVISRPILDSIDRLFLRNRTFLAGTTTRRYLFHHRLLGKERGVFLVENQPQI